MQAETLCSNKILQFLTGMLLMQIGLYDENFVDESVSMVCAYVCVGSCAELLCDNCRHTLRRRSEDPSGRLGGTARLVGRAKVHAKC